MQKTLFEKNIQALQNTKLKEKLLHFEQITFQIIQGSDPLDINFIHNGGGYTLYSNSLSELNEKLNLYNDKYLLYPVLYFYGFGNGILYKALLQNKNRQKIVVFEKELEFIYLSFHLLDFSEELKSGSLIVLDTQDLIDLDFQLLCSSAPFFIFLRVYFLDIHCNYYEKYQEDILNTNSNMQLHIKQIILTKGNSSQDALMGIENYIYNLPDIISNYSFKELSLKRKNSSKYAIIVSTGPSLIKQLPLLKQYADKASIFCADSAYPILAKHNIKPDYVLSLERVDFTSEFFNNDFKELDKDVLFVCTNVIHHNTINFLEKNHRKFMFMQIDSSFSNYLKLKDFGNLHSSPSVAHMAYSLAIHLEHKNIIFIGQDLAYAKDGSSHPKEYHYGQYDTYDPKDISYHLTTIAYGGQDKVFTNEIWMLFKKMLEFLIFSTPHITTYNCTEGGARIEGTIEKPFKQICKQLLTKKLKKPFVKLEKLTQNKQKELMLKAFYKVHKSINKCEKLESYLQEIYLKCNVNLENDNNFNHTIQILDNLKYMVDDLKTMQDLYEILSPSLHQFELNLARIYVLNPKTKEDAFNKTLLWIKEHLEWILMLSNHIKALKITLEKNIINLEKKLENQNLHQYIQKIKKVKLYFKDLE
ncbi:motility associated factor glycosyltransferase family protein [Campylobacter lari]|uniref:motility associated factor glycosyltransferase family protein n=1 Tax=Campylobacter lari TaxID=201 RepID=UPI00179970D8|nr:motility associated factor glycosyltransferase family protein [Campylobacter lari]EAI4428619.1 motility associated factor glycosyltransferase family protein [Campylobacter lari]EGK1190125.1 motility associated factor glycosyltransferase family protein [Campylobacter lari]MCR2079868.1 motility associated factor glycosyltransferase family protein [Campylobacter lari subsp. concheus]